MIFIMPKQRLSNVGKMYWQTEWYQCIKLEKSYFYIIESGKKELQVMANYKFDKPIIDFIIF